MKLPVIHRRETPPRAPDPGPRDLRDLREARLRSRLALKHAEKVLEEVRAIEALVSESVE